MSAPGPTGAFHRSKRALLSRTSESIVILFLPYTDEAGKSVRHHEDTYVAGRWQLAILYSPVFIALAVVTLDSIHLFHPLIL